MDFQDVYLYIYINNENGNVSKCVKVSEKYFPVDPDFCMKLGVRKILPKQKPKDTFHLNKPRKQTNVP